MAPLVWAAATHRPAVQLAELEEGKRSAAARIDTLERNAAAAARGAQEREAVVVALEQRAREVAAAARVAEAAEGKVRALRLQAQIFGADLLWNRVPVSPSTTVEDMHWVPCGRPGPQCVCDVCGSVFAHRPRPTS
jgi:hypothetical protein